MATEFSDNEVSMARRYSLVLFGVLAGLHVALALAFWTSEAGSLPFQLEDWHANLAFVVSLGLALIVGALVFRSFSAMDRLLKPALGVAKLQSALSIYGALSFAFLVILRGVLGEEAELSQAVASGIAMAGMAAALVLWAIVVRRFALRLRPDPLD